MRTLPLVAGSIPPMIWISVLLPQPLGPRMQANRRERKRWEKCSSPPPPSGPPNPSAPPPPPPPIFPLPALSRDFCFGYPPRPPPPRWGGGVGFGAQGGGGRESGGGGAATTAHALGSAPSPDLL